MLPASYSIASVQGTGESLHMCCRRAASTRARRCAPHAAQHCSTKDLRSTRHKLDYQNSTIGCRPRRTAAAGDSVEIEC